MAMKVIIFNVEHGFCGFIKTPTNHAVMIDCGCTDTFSPALYLADNDLKYATGWNYRNLTLLYVTHPHDDHIEDISTVKAQCPPALLFRQTYDWEKVKSAQEADYENLDVYSKWQADYNTTPATYPDYGMFIKSYFLTPDQAKKVDEGKYINNSSLVTVAAVKGTLHEEKFLFGGDMETAGWEALLKQNTEFASVVKGVNFFVTSHHGHCSGFSAALFEAMGSPPYVNIVSIHHNDEHIAGEYLKEAYAVGITERGATGIDFKGNDRRRMLTTRTDGTITVNVTDEGKYWVEAAHLADNRKTKAAKASLW